MRPEQLRARREELGLTRGQLGHQVNLSAATIKAYELANRKIPKRAELQLQAVLGNHQYALVGPKDEVWQLAATLKEARRKAQRLADDLGQPIRVTLWMDVETIYPSPTQG